jgi:hypothetical protein
MRILLTLITCVSIVYSSHAADPKRIYNWQEGPLQWSFFEEKESLQSTAPAFSSLGVTYSFDVKNGVPLVSFVAFIDPASSWVKPASATANCLKHEQLLFDVAEWHARKMRKAIVAHCAKEQVSYPFLISEIKNVYQKELNIMFALLNQLNAETNYGENEEAEKVWQQRVNEELSGLSAFI